MAQRGRDHHNHSTGAYAGGQWKEYRYGRAASTKHEPIYRGEARQHKIHQVMDQMRHWRMSPFEFEGATIAAIRSTLCLEGYGWQRSNREATSLVADVLRRMGTVRPTWEQGQREYSIPAEDCSWCCGPIDADLLRGSNPLRFCSDECARFARKHRDFETRSREDAVWANIQATIERMKTPARNCTECGKSFRPLNWVGRGEYCSNECKAAAATYLPEQDCLNCGERFKPRMAGKKYCSPECAYAHERPKQHCVVCADPFRPRSGYSFFCSETCNKRAYAIRKGKVKKNSPPVFDYLLHLQGQRFTEAERIAA